MVVQPDGKIVASGDLRKSQYDEQRLFMYRLMPDGGLDPSFGEGGIVVSKHALATNSRALILRPNGKLILGSTFNVYGQIPSYQLESFNPDGSVDEGFGLNGKAKFTFGKVAQDTAWFTDMIAMVLQPDGKIVCAGNGGKGYWHMALCRFNEKGLIDESFGDGYGVIILCGFYIFEVGGEDIITVVAGKKDITF